MPPPDQPRRRGQTIPPGEQGMALPLALIIGALLLVASAGLVAKLLLLRSAGAAESYKQIAELASSNGISRILSKLNDSQSDDISYLWRLSQDLQLEPVGSPLRQWDITDPAIRPLMEQPCAPLNLTAETRAILQGGEMAPGMNLRSDGRQDNVGMSYRLRSYSYSPGDSKAIFTVEGYATQGSGNTLNVLARSLLTRVLELKRVVRSDDDWGVIAARNISLGPTSITGPGKVLWLVEAANASRFGVAGSCTPSSLGAALASSNANTQSKLWPVVGSDFPSPGVFDQLATIDQITGTATPQRRIWNIDDKRATTCSGATPGTGATGEGICVRGEASATWSSGETTASVKRSGGVGSSITSITLHADKICAGSSTSQPCLIWIESIQLRNGATLSIETANSQGARPVILRLLRPQESINIVNGRLCQANYATSSTTTLPCSSDAKAENLAIVASNGDNSINCTTATQSLKFGGSSLPAALVLMPQGTVSINATATMNGVIWAGNICAGSGIALSTNNPDGSSIVRAFRNTWKWDDSLTFGRTITRGIRGTGLDLFRRW
jgi:hypothetical protein